MNLNQYAVFQLKPDASTRPLRYKSYKHVIENNISVVSDNYHQVYITSLIQDTMPEEIRGQLEKKLPSKFKGNALNVSDIIVITAPIAAAVVEMVSSIFGPQELRTIPPAALEMTQPIAYDIVMSDCPLTLSCLSNSSATIYTEIGANIAYEMIWKEVAR